MPHYPITSRGGVSVWSALYERDPNWIRRPMLRGLSWYTEGIHGVREILDPPERALVILEEGGQSVWIVDPDSGKTWMRFVLPANGGSNIVMNGVMAAGCEITAAKLIDGTLFVGVAGPAGAGLYAIDFVNDGALMLDAAGIYQYLGRISDRDAGGWGALDAPLPGFAGGNCVHISAITGMRTLVTYANDAGEVSFVEWNGVDSRSITMQDATGVTGYGAEWLPDTAFAAMMVNDPISSSVKVGVGLAMNFAAAATWSLLGTPFDFADFANGGYVTGFQGDASLLASSVPIGGYYKSGLPTSFAVAKTAASEAASDAYFVGAIGVGGGKLSVVRIGEVPQAKTIDTHAARPFTIVPNSADFMWARFGAKGSDFVHKYEPFGSWIWADTTTDITARSHDLTAVGGPAYSVFRTTFDGVNDYAHGDLSSMTFGDGGFTVSGLFAAANAIGYKPLVTMYDVGGAPADDEKVFRLHLNGADLYFQIYDNSVCKAGANCAIGRMATGLLNALPAATSFFHAMAVYDPATPSDPVRIYVNGERVDDADAGINAISFEQVENAAVELAIAADYAAGSAAHFAAIQASRVSLDYGPVAADGVPGYYEMSTPLIPNDVGYPYDAAILYPASGFDDYDGWDDGGGGPANAWFEFDGSRYLRSTLSNVPALTPTTGLYMSFWFQADDASAAHQALVSRYADTFEIALGGIAAGAADNHVHLQFNTNALGGGNDLINPVAVANGDWTHVAVFFHEDDGNVYLWVNGTVATEAFAGPIAGSVEALYVGARRLGAGVEHEFSGKIAGLRIAAAPFPMVFTLQDVAEMVYLEYIDGRRCMGSVERLLEAEDVEVCDSRTVGVITAVSPRFAYQIGVDGHVVSSERIPDGSGKTYVSRMYHEDAALTTVYSDGTRDSVPYATTAEGAARESERATMEAMMSMFGTILTAATTGSTLGMPYDVDANLFNLTCVNPPGITLEDGFPTLDFDPLVVEQTFHAAKIPDSYVPGTNALVMYELFGDAPDGVDHAIVMGLDYKVIANGDPFDFVAAVVAAPAVTVPIPALEANKTTHTASFVIPSAALAPGSFLLFRAYRIATDPADDYAQDARVFKVHVRFEAK